MGNRDDITSQARQTLEAMSLEQRINAISDDLRNCQDKFASITAHELAHLLGVAQPENPISSEWSFYKYVEPFTLNDYLANSDTFWTVNVVEALSRTVAKERLIELEKLTEQLEGSSSANNLDFLADHETELIIDILVQERLEEAWAPVVARTSVEDAAGHALVFEGNIEDDGACIHLRTPYDIRDSGFAGGDNWVASETW